MDRGANIVGGGFGAATGLFAEIGVAIATGGISLLFPTVITQAGAHAGRGLGHLINKLDRMAEGINPEEIRRELETLEPIVQSLQNSLAEADGYIVVLGGIEQKARNAVNVGNLFTTDEYRQLSTAQHSKYLDVTRKQESVEREALKVPGFLQQYQRLAQVSPRRSLREILQDVEKDLDTESPDTQALALQRFYQLERGRGNFEQSQEVYPPFLNNSNSHIRSTALATMIDEPRIRPSEKVYIATIEKFLAGEEHEPITIAIKAILQDPEEKLASSTINYYLKKIAGPGSPYPAEIRDQANEALQRRREIGVLPELNSRESANAVLDSYVGNDHLKRPLASAIVKYQGAMEDVSSEGPALKLYASGPAGIGKTTIIARVHRQLTAGPRGLVPINMGLLDTLDQLVGYLKEAAPLQGKTILLDEFHGIDTIRPPEEQARVVEFLKRAFTSQDDSTDGASDHEKLRQEYGLDFRNTILAVVTNLDIDRLNCLKEDNPIGAALKSRIHTGVALNLNPDLRDRIPEFVERFTQDKLYRYAPDRRFSRNIELEFSDDARAALITDLQETTRNRERVSGRDLMEGITQEVNAAIGRYKEDHPEDRLIHVEEGDEIGKVIQPLVLDVEDGFYAVRPVEKPNFE